MSSSSRRMGPRAGGWVPFSLASPQPRPVRCSHEKADLLSLGGSLYTSRINVSPPPPPLALLARDIDSEAECISHFRYPNTWVEQPDLPAAAGQVWSYDTPSLEIALQSL